MHRQKCCFSWTDLRFLNEDQKVHEILFYTVVEEETELLIFVEYYLFLSTSNDTMKYSFSTLVSVISIA